MAPSALDLWYGATLTAPTHLNILINLDNYGGGQSSPVPISFV
jgi:hypothetical protein